MRSFKEEIKNAKKVEDGIYIRENDFAYTIIKKYNDKDDSFTIKHYPKHELNIITQYELNNVQ